MTALPRTDGHRRMARQAAKLCHALALGGTLLLAWGTHTAAAGGVSQGELERSGRPANLYRLVIDHVPEVCGPMLAALNRPYRPERPWSEGAVGLLLHNDLEIRWRPDRYEWINSAGFRTESTLEFGKADLDQDGDADHILRKRFLVGGREMTRLWIAPILPDDRTPGGTLTYDAAKALFDASTVLDFGYAQAPEVTEVLRADPASRLDALGQVIATVVRIDGNAYALVSDYQPQSTDNNVFLLRGNAGWRWSVTCVMRHALEYE